ncbi:MAG: gamma-glutamyltransferase [Alphaproteobacteria bacterium]|nr:gamma-glutamyltransferase [Alphaproteobacteria bacterium]
MSITRPESIAAAASVLVAAATMVASAAVLPPVEGASGMVVSAQHLASEVGIDILKKGGNAVDAAVAVGYALAVVHPCCGNLGGGGFMTIHRADGRDIFIDFREKAPIAATATMYLDAAGAIVPERSTRGYLAAGVPGSPLGLDTALQKYGTMRRGEVLAPAIRLAREGFVLAQGDVDILETTTRQFAEEPNVAAIFLEEGKPYRAGERLVQTSLARTLESLAKEGPDAFYRGPIASAIAEASAAHGGILTREDLAQYSIAEETPIRCRYHGYDIVSAPPPSSGGTTLCEILGILDGDNLGSLGFHSARGVHLMVEAMRHAYLDRNTYLGDPAFVANPLERLLSPEHAASIRAAIADARATPSQEIAAGTSPHEGTNTTHVSVVDRWGNAVALTTTINLYFGAKVIAGDTGFFLNDEMDDFTSKPGSPNAFGLVQGAANAIQPGKRPLSSMTPTILMKDGRVFMVVGSPGGARIITITLETILNVIDHGMSLAEAVDAPRLHHQWLPDTIFAEPFALSPDTAQLLRQMGYAITEQVPWGSAAAILVGPQRGTAAAGLSAGGDDSVHGGGIAAGRLYGASDARQPAGAAIGY